MTKPALGAVSVLPLTLLVVRSCSLWSHRRKKSCEKKQKQQQQNNLILSVLCMYLAVQYVVGLSEMARKAKDKRGFLGVFFGLWSCFLFFWPVWCVYETMLSNSKWEFYFAELFFFKKNVRGSNATEMCSLQKPKMYTLKSSKDNVCQPLVKVKVKSLSHVLLFATPQEQ